MYRTAEHILRCGLCKQPAVAQCRHCNMPVCRRDVSARTTLCLSCEFHLEERAASRAKTGVVALGMPALAVALGAAFSGITAFLLPTALLAIAGAMAVAPAAARKLARARLGRAKHRLALPPGRVADDPAAEPVLESSETIAAPPAVPDCDQCAAATATCRRCGKPVCAAHSTELDFFVPTVECADATTCRPKRRAPKAASPSTPGSNRRWRQVGPGIVYD